MRVTGPATEGGSASGEVYLERARTLGPRLAAAAVEIERRRELPEPIVEALAAAGLFRLLLPRSLDGGELAPAAYVGVIEEIARHDASVAWCLGQACGCTMTAAHLKPDVAHKIFAHPRGILAWGPPGPGEARIAPGGYNLSGTWSFASGSHHATWLGAHVAVFAANGAPRLRSDGSPVFRTLLFPKSRAAMADTWHVVGLRGTGSDTYTVSGLFVPEDYTVERGAEAKPYQTGLLYAFSSSNMYSVGFAGVALGIAQGVFDAFVELARDKIPRGARGTLRENNVVQSQVAQCEARLRSSRAFIHETLEEMWETAERKGEFDYDQHVRLRLSTTWAIHQARDVVATVYGAAGSTAVFNENPFERRLRDIHAGTQQGQGRPIHFETVGQVLLGLPPQGRMFR